MIGRDLLEDGQTELLEVDLKCGLRKQIDAKDVLICAVEFCFVEFEWAKFDVGDFDKVNLFGDARGAF